MIDAKTDTGLRSSRARPAPAPAKAELLASSVMSDDENEAGGQVAGRAPVGRERQVLGARNGRKESNREQKVTKAPGAAARSSADLRGRVEDMEELVLSLKSQIIRSSGEMEAVDEQIGTMAKAKSELRRSLVATATASPRNSPYPAGKCPTCAASKAAANVAREEAAAALDAAEMAKAELAEVKADSAVPCDACIRLEDELADAVAKAASAAAAAAAQNLEIAELREKAAAECEGCIAVTARLSDATQVARLAEEKRDGAVKAAAAATTERDAALAARDELASKLATFEAAQTDASAAVTELTTRVELAEAERDAAVSAVAELTDAVAEATARADAAAADAEAAAAARDEASAAHDGLVAELEITSCGRDEAIAARDELAAELALAVSARDEASEACTSIQTELTQVMAARDAAAASAAELSATLETTSAELDDARSQLEELQTEAETAAAEAKAAAAAEVESLKAEHATAIGEMQTMFAQLEDNCSQLAATCESLTSQLDTAESANLEFETRVAELEAATEAARSETTAALKVGEELRTALAASNEALEAERVSRESADARAAELEAELEAVKAARHADEMHRRALHEMVQKLRGNIRVFCRVRPLLGSEGTNSGSVPYAFPGENPDFTSSVLVTAPGKGSSTREREYDFPFDAVFGPTATQADVYGQLAPCVQSALDGYNVTVFAYGQTGSGKTYTMEGYPECGVEAIGMIPRAVANIFERAAAQAELGWSYTFEASYLEIYNETVRDLLAPDADAAAVELEVRMDRESGETYAAGLTWRPVAQAADVDAVLALARTNRSVGATNMNARSSRSHSVFTLKISGAHAENETAWSGKLNLVDLAGSERLAKSQSSGERLKETQAINKSLSALSNCIAAIGKKASHIPYRNSKLTYLLKPALGGDSKVLMFANVSPAPSNMQESLCTLRFATNVNNTVVGVAHRNA
ncbi:uncharacterized protein AMSG_06148 [Thecamonas trahens ATCC 50062]|uniref:Kinesin-like protein n=1 Tax=Thecamonas trahens ATCC 50062 TaxID=461836 RepID=A0A0L0DBY0_THETB|nr:hypothetical protein AMSG_06148 [Thecamonas trahens ATCC 50062]KNC49859.1 hypothetical protein AMSG_06148 [Thecamonas trahens ATCC 50062]|eukprot:XP_013757343.1 hypothetical protein AMSG_06148 [Thecamonas trahens ATCC 50062]